MNFFSPKNLRLLGWNSATRKKNQQVDLRSNLEVDISYSNSWRKKKKRSWISEDFEEWKLDIGSMDDWDRV